LLIVGGIKKKRKLYTILGGVLLAATFLFMWFMGFWADKLWFQSVGFIDRFWTEFTIKLGCGIFSFLIGGLYMFILLIRVNKLGTGIKAFIVVVTAFLTGLIGAGIWDEALQFFNRVPTGTIDPVFGLDVSFYMFSLPFISGVYKFFMILSFISLIIGLFILILRNRISLVNGVVEPDEESSDEPEKKTSGPFLFGSALFLLFTASGWIIRRFQLLYSSGGTVNGPGWTDVYIRFPAMIVAAIIGVVGVFFIIIPGLRKASAAPLKKLNKLNESVKSVAVIFTMTTVLWILILGIIPGVSQALFVAPNEITYEKPFIESNIKFTRDAFKLSSVQEKEYPMESVEFNSTIVEENSAIINNTRLWDWRALSSLYQQFQEIRLYYKFGDIDMDRYEINGEKRAVMIAAREMELSNLTAQSQNFVNERFKYTHGYGIAMNTVNEFTASGLPHLLIKDIPPVSETEELKVTRPEIYYGERTNSYVIANSSEKEFDYPQGDKNSYVSYAGDGGVQISSFFRKFLYGFKYNSTKLLFSNYPKKDSRILLNRNIVERVQLAAPFLKFDNDPYIVLINGELRWFIDAYTTSRNYPYSEHFSGTLDGGSISTKSLSRGINYVRNSVKAVVNPYNGKMDFYIYDEEDPVIKVWNNIYPGLFKDKASMPDKFKAHVRYPADFLLIQGEMYAKYHMTVPEVFYNQEDIWVRATEKYYSAVQPVEPYYIMWERQGADKPEFIIMLPYTPKNKQVLIGWIAGMSDPEYYGDIIVYKFPKDKRVLGPQQVETKIDQDSFLSGQLSLWDQRGSNVIRGNMLALPLGGTLLYVEPIYLQSETAAYPELRLVVLMHNDKISYAETLEKALIGLYEDSATMDQYVNPGNDSAGGVTQTLLKQADETFNNYLEATGKGNLTKAGEELQHLKDLFENIPE
jgi:uncharacterized membrane protein (UPF0182 family)